jgi:hypothetical protein
MTYGTFVNFQKSSEPFSHQFKTFNGWLRFNRVQEILDCAQEKHMPTLYYMTMNGKRQGPIKARSLGKTHRHSGAGTSAHGFEYGVEAPFDAGAGQTSGARQHGPSGPSAPTKVPFQPSYTPRWIGPVSIPPNDGKPQIPITSFSSGDRLIKVTRPIDSFSPQLQLAHSAAEVLTEVVLVAQLGGATLKKVTLQDAVITGLIRCFEFPPRHNEYPPVQGYQTLELSYARITVS